MAKRWLPEEDDRLFALLAEGKSIPEIARQGLLAARSEGMIWGRFYELRANPGPQQELSSAAHTEFVAFLERRWKHFIPTELVELWNQKIAPASGYPDINLHTVKYWLDKLGFKLSAGQKQRLIHCHDRANFSGAQRRRRKEQQEQRRRILEHRDGVRASGRQVPWRSCLDCGESLPLDEVCFRAYFSLSRNKTYFSSRCISCCNQLARKKHAAHARLIVNVDELRAVASERNKAFTVRSEEYHRQLLHERQQYLSEHPDCPTALCPSCNLAWPLEWPRSFPDAGRKKGSKQCRVCLNRRKRNEQKLRRRKRDDFQIS